MGMMQKLSPHQLMDILATLPPEVGVWWHLLSVVLLVTLRLVADIL